MIEELKKGKKCFFFCSSRAKLTDYFLPAIRQAYPDKKIIEYHSKKITIDLATVNEQWKDADLICATCSITVGCNFDLVDIFNSLHCYVSACSKNLVRDIFQCLYRIRHIKDKILHYFLDTRCFGMNLSCNPTEIRKELENKTHFYTKHYEEYVKIEYNTKTPIWIKELLINNIFESNMSIMNLEPLFDEYLNLCGYKKPIDDKFEEDFTEDAVNIIFEDYQYEDIPEITFTQRQELVIKKQKQPLTDLEEFTLNKSFFQATLIVQGRSKISMTDQVTLWNTYSNYGKSKFRNLQYEKGLQNKTIRICDIISMTLPELADNLSRRLENIYEITRKFDLENSQDFKNISVESIDKNIDWLRDNSIRFHTNFNIRNQGKNKTFERTHGLELLNKIFSSWGYSEIKKGKRQQSRVNGVRVDVSNYEIKNTEEIDVYKFLEPKSKKQTEIRILQTYNIMPLLDGGDE